MTPRSSQKSRIRSSDPTETRLVARWTLGDQMARVV